MESTDWLEICRSRSIIQSDYKLEIKDSNKKFTIVSYNILADIHAQRDYSKADFITTENLSEINRHKKILSELKHLDADIVCLQEVGTKYFQEILLNDMTSLGYEGKFVARQDPYTAEGEATFFKTSKFKLVEFNEVILSDCISSYVKGLPNMDDSKTSKLINSLDTFTVALIFQLRSVTGSFDVVVGNAHIGYENLIRQDKQCIQIHFILKKMVGLLTQNCPVPKCSIICGDFNSWPGTAPNILMKTGTLNGELSAELKKIPAGDGLEAVVDLVPELFLLPIGYQYKSAYEEVLKQDELSTRYNSSNSLKAVDYIYFDADKMLPLTITKLSDANKYLGGGAPNNLFPSDHLSLKAEFGLLI